jgi:hypothetical protein
LFLLTTSLAFLHDRLANRLPLGGDALEANLDSETFGNDAETFGEVVKQHLSPVKEEVINITPATLFASARMSDTKASILPSTPLLPDSLTLENELRKRDTTAKFIGGGGGVSTIGGSTPLLPSSVLGAPLTSSLMGAWGGLPSLTGTSPPAPHLQHEKDLKLYGDNWYYRDPNGVERGPFTDEEMRNWFLIGYFPNHLPLRRGDRMYLPLDQIFVLGRETAFTRIEAPASTVSSIFVQDSIEALKVAEMRRQQQAQLEEENRLRKFCVTFSFWFLHI